MKTLHSKIDKSVNFVEEALTGFLESRYVRKEDKYFICYLSSQSGCNRGCRFCHLTATGQTSFTDALVSDFITQWHNIEEQYLASKNPAEYVHFNFMARGEPLANKHLLERGDFLLNQLGELARHRNLKSKFNVSTIMPVTFDREISDIFNYIHPTIYYSLYSVNEKFRQKWLPAAMPVKQAIEKLKRYQDFSKKIIKIHHAFIKGENDSFEDVDAMDLTLYKSGLEFEFNIVRYNPFSPEQGEEPDLEHIKQLQWHIAAGRSKIIPRVGPDVKASCGMFVNEDGTV